MHYTGFNWYAASATLVAVLALLWRMHRSRPSPPLPPGPPTLPLLGNLLSLSPPLHLHFTGLIKKYGPIYRLWFGHKLCVVISSPAIASEALVDNDVIMANHDVSAAARLIGYHGNVVFAPLGPEWSMVRGVMAKELLNPDSLDELYAVRRREVRTVVSQVRESAGKEVDLGAVMFVAVVNSILGVAGAGSMEGEERMRVGKEVRGMLGELSQLFVTPNVSDFFPALERFDFQGVQKRMVGVMERIDGFFSSFIEKKQQQRKRGIPVGSKKDFLDHVLDLVERDSDIPFTIAHIKGIFLSMIAGGADTTSTTLEWTMTELLRNPEIMRRAQQELDRVVGKANIVEGHHLSELRYVRAVIKETIRLHPASPFLVPHAPSESCVVGGYTIPKGTKIFFNVWAIQKDPSLWKDPLKFDPERFLAADSDIVSHNNLDLKGNGDFSFFPMGAGKRICAGISFTERLTSHIVASILHSFHLETPTGEMPDLEETFGMVLKKKNSLVVVPTPRLENRQQYY